MTEQEEQSTGLFRPLVVRGVPLHSVVPAAAGLLGVALLVTGGGASVLGGWILTVAFPLALGAFVADPRALAAPAVLWAGWLVVVAAAGSGSSLPQTSVGLAVALAVLGAAGVWLGQRAVQPAVDLPHHGRARGRQAPDIDALLEPRMDPADSLSLDPSAEVDEALAELLDGELDEREDGLGVDDEAGAAETPTAVAGDGADPESNNLDAQVEPQTAPVGSDEPDDDATGHVIEFAALSEDDLISGDNAADDAPLPAATEAGRLDRS